MKVNLIKGLFYVIGLCAIISLFVFLFEKRIRPEISKDVSNEYSNEIYNDYYEVVIDKKYIDSTHHNNVTIIGKDVSSGKEKIIVGSRLYSELYEQVSVGDTIVKKKNSFQFFINNRYRKIYNYIP